MGSHKVPYSTKFWQINHFMSFGKENVGGFTIANVSYLSEPGIWLGKILVNDVRFSKFAKVFARQNFVLYGSRQMLGLHYDSQMASTGVIFTSTYHHKIAKSMAKLTS